MKTRLLFRLIDRLLRVLCFLIIISLLIQYDEIAKFSLANLYEIASPSFYIFLLIIFILIVRDGIRNGFILIKIEKYIRYLKWVFVLETIFLLSIKSVIINRSINEARFKPVDFSAITTPNLGFIIITLLTFFIAALLAERNRLKEEQDLTI